MLEIITNDRNRNKKFDRSIIKRFIRSGKFVGIYNSVVKQDSKGVPFLEVTMNTDNRNLVSLVPNVVTDRKTMTDYKVIKVSASSNPNPIV